MEQAARRYARWVLLLHAVVLAAVLGFIVMSIRSARTSAHRQAVAQAAQRQELLTGQTARGIESFYDAVVGDLDLLRRADAAHGIGLATPPGSGDASSRLANFPKLLWDQLSPRATHLMVFDRATGNSRALAADPDAVPAAVVVEQARNWLSTVDKVAVSKPRTIGGRTVNLVCVPAGTDARRILAAVVPVDLIRDRFLSKLGDDAGSGGAAVLDDALVAVTASKPQLIGADFARIGGDPGLTATVAQVVRDRRPVTLVVDRPVIVGGVTLGPAVVSVEPITLPGGKTWWVHVATSLREVEAVTDAVLRRAVRWAVVAVVSMTAVLVSTAASMIRSRARLERARHELLTREIDQARQIQLAWLPQRRTRPGLDVAAVNTPASHISGDFYDWFDLPDGRTVVTIGDVTGHGMSAAFLMSTTQLLVRTTMPRVGDPGRCLEEVNSLLCQQVHGGQFVTMIVMVIDPADGSLEVASAGHPPPLVGEDAGGLRELDVVSALVLGIEPDETYPVQRHALPPRAARLVLYTDGVVDAQSPGGARFSAHQLATGIATATPRAGESAQALVDAAVAAVDAFRAGRPLADDLTLVAVQLDTIRAEASTGASVPRGFEVDPNEPRP